MTVQPLPGRVGPVGGAESVEVDQVRWYFGFDYGSDLVLSPLAGGRRAMAGFAAEHMRQVDGAHAPANWPAVFGAIAS